MSIIAPRAYRNISRQRLMQIAIVFEKRELKRKAKSRPKFEETSCCEKIFLSYYRDYFETLH